MGRAYIARPILLIQMKRYLLISHRYPKLRRGAHTTARRLAREFPEYLDYKTDEECIGKLDQFNEQYRKLIFVTQAPRMYQLKANFLNLRNLNYSYFIRGENNPSVYKNPTTNGFYYGYMYSDIEFYVPFIFDFQVKNASKVDNLPVVGFYIRPFLVPDALDYAVNFAKNVQHEIRLYILGECDHNFSKYKNIISYNQTLDNKEFFSKITHYIYPKSAWFKDPFPNTLLEAVQCNKQICLPTIIGRNHKDGIDDISEVIKYHIHFNQDTVLDNSSNVLTLSNFRNFYLALFDNDFKYVLDKEKYKSFSSWLTKEIL